MCVPGKTLCKSRCRLPWHRLLISSLLSLLSPETAIRTVKHFERAQHRYFVRDRAATLLQLPVEDCSVGVAPRRKSGSSVKNFAEASTGTDEQTDSQLPERAPFRHGFQERYCTLQGGVIDADQVRILRTPGSFFVCLQRLRLRKGQCEASRRSTPCLRSSDRIRDRTELKDTSVYFF